MISKSQSVQSAKEKAIYIYIYICMYVCMYVYTLWCNSNKTILIPNLFNWNWMKAEIEFRHVGSWVRRDWRDE